MVIVLITAGCAVSPVHWDLPGSNLPLAERQALYQRQSAECRIVAMQWAPFIPVPAQWFYFAAPADGWAAGFRALGEALVNQATVDTYVRARASAFDDCM